MKKSKPILFSIIGLTFLFYHGCQHFNLGEEEQNFVSKEESFAKQVDVPPGVNVLEIKHQGANVQVKGWEKSHIQIEGVRKAKALTVMDARLLLESIEILVYQRASNRLVLDYKGTTEKDKNNPLQDSIDYTAYVPRSMVVMMDTDYAAVNISDMLNRVTIDHNIGELIVKDIDGFLIVNAREGSVTIENVKKNLDLKAKQSNVVIRNVNADVNVDHKEGDVTIEHIDGVVRVDNGYRSNIHIEDVDERLIITNYQGDVTCSHFYEGIDITVNNGDVKLEPGIPVQRDYYCTVIGGDLTLRVPDSSNMLMELEAENGRIHSDFSLPIWGERNVTYARGGINNAHHNVRMKVKDGSLSIQKAVERPERSSSASEEEEKDEENVTPNSSSNNEDLLPSEAIP